jgi:hypothetical protein
MAQKHPHFTDWHPAAEQVTGDRVPHHVHAHRRTYASAIS